MVIGPEFRMRQHRDDDHRESTTHFIQIGSKHPVWFDKDAGLYPMVIWSESCMGSKEAMTIGNAHLTLQ